MTSCTELLEALKAALLAEQDWQRFEELANALSDLPDKHFATCVKALEETTASFHAVACHAGHSFQNCRIVSMQQPLEKPRTALAALRRALEAALEVN